MKELLMKYKLHLLVIVLVSTTVFTITNYINTQSELDKAKQLLLVELDSEIITKTIISKQKDITLTDKQIKELESKMNVLDYEYGFNLDTVFVSHGSAGNYDDTVESITSIHESIFPKE